MEPHISLLSPSPAPPPLSPPSAMATAPGVTLFGRINDATRKQHTELNRLLINRLPLALPPRQSNPILFSRGLGSFARIFLLFEMEWDALVRHTQQRVDVADYSHEVQVRRWLANLRPSGLARSTRLENDLRYLRTIVGSQIYNTPGLGKEWIFEMRASMRKKPHILVAFAWVFYMATFAGGRWIRQQLANGGPEFWTQRKYLAKPGQDASQSLFDLPGFSFLSFHGDQDGEDVKTTFKARLVEADALLTPQEKEEVIEVAKKLFDRSIHLVTEIDRMVWRDQILSYPSMTYAFLTLLALALLLRVCFRHFAGDLP